MQPEFLGVSVSREDGDEIGTYIWSITFDHNVGNTALLGILSVGISGDGSSINSYTVQDGLRPSIQRISTTASSPLDGYFTLSLDGYTTDPIMFDADVSALKAIVQAMPSVGEVDVSREYTGSIDDRLWEVPSWNETRESVHLINNYPSLLHELNTYDWLITFKTRSGDVPLMSACCDEQASNEQNPFFDTPATLTSSFSQDSLISISTEQVGETSTINGLLRVQIGTYMSEPFALNATGSEVKSAILAGGISHVEVYASNVTDENGHKLEY